MARAALNWSIDDLAAAASVGRATVTRFENGTAARPETIKAISDAIREAGVTIIATGERSMNGGLGVRLTEG
ncbi:helix-turn-helix domain-containing protein [Sphingomonas endolithica]|uniref:helix-turn-helix domain-containing protein n=1 Tax=Sphingomonas endolithica TaxID=2972485 RepID=UPI0021AEAE0B|nr:helix-turn-helix transcriptional regulator [Sphingomonas sp. ZFBP2030]